MHLMNQAKPAPFMPPSLSAVAGVGRTLHALHLRLRHLLPHALQKAGGRGASHLQEPAERREWRLDGLRADFGHGGDMTKEGVMADITPVAGDLSDSEVRRCSVCRFLVPVCLFVWYVDVKLLTFLHWSLTFRCHMVCFSNCTFSAWKCCLIPAYWFIYERLDLFLRFLRLSEKYILDYVDF